jgi:hypothetical protein
MNVFILLYWFSLVVFKKKIFGVGSIRTSAIPVQYLRQLLAYWSVSAPNCSVVFIAKLHFIFILSWAILCYVFIWLNKYSLQPFVNNKIETIFSIFFNVINGFKQFKVGNQSVLVLVHKCNSNEIAPIWQQGNKTPTTYDHLVHLRWGWSTIEQSGRRHSTQMG